jgi:hypothetical protein
MTKVLDPIFTKAKVIYATDFNGQILKSEPLLIFHYPTEKLPDKLLNI